MVTIQSPETFVCANAVPATRPSAAAIVSIRVFMKLLLRTAYPRSSAGRTLGAERSRAHFPERGLTIDSVALHGPFHRHVDRLASVRHRPRQRDRVVVDCPFERHL